MKKASMQLSVNFIVVMIISVIILSAGLVMLNKIRIGSEKWIEDAKRVNREKLTGLYCDRDRFVVFPNKEVISAKEGIIITTCIYNDLGADSNFYVLVEDTSGGLIDVVYNAQAGVIRNRQIGYSDIMLINEAGISGSSYMFTICTSTNPIMSCEEELFGQKRVFQLNVR